MLARFGADVIKLDPAQPKYDPRVSVIFGLPASRGKRSVMADVKSPGAILGISALMHAPATTSTLLWAPVACVPSVLH